jgi:N-acetylmuramoyl-L-alanine amidase
MPRKLLVFLIPLLVRGLFPAAVAQTLALAADKPFVPDRRPLQGLTITVDPAGGGAGYGAEHAGGASAALADDLNMLVAGHLQHHLRRAGAIGHLTRWDDRTVALGDADAAAESVARRKVAVDTRSHLFVSIHHGAARPATPATAETPLARALGAALRTVFEQQVRDGERPNVRVETLAPPTARDVPAVTVEIEFPSDGALEAWAHARGRHRDVAIGLYNGIVRVWQEQRAELEATRARAFPDSAPASRATAAGDATETFPNPNGRPKLTRLARELWLADRPPQTPREVEWLLHEYARRVVTDLTFFHLRTQVEEDGDTWVVRGTTNFSRLKDAVPLILEAVGCRPVRNEVELLPTARLGEERFGVVRVPTALTWTEPHEKPPTRTQLLLGERVFLLDITPDGDDLLLHAGDGYVGWVRRDAVSRMDAAGFAEWERARTATITRDYVLDGLRVPAGAALPIVGEGDGGAVRLRLPPGVRPSGAEAIIAVPAAQLRMPPATPPGLEVARTAAEYLTVPYVFGGRSRLGLDCSGLTGVAYASVGLELPRDAHQQILVGRMVATPWHLSGLQVGDLLFFCDESGSVIHTGVSLGGLRFIHSMPPEVQVSSLDPADPLYSAVWAGNFAFARRPLP